MNAIDQSQTLILNKALTIPPKGMICAHPGRTKRIAEEFFTQSVGHTDYRGFQVYTGKYKGKEVFVANTGIGAPAAAFLVEELASFGAKRILRLGSNDSSFSGFKLKIVEETTLPIGLCDDYESSIKSIKISSDLLNKIKLLAQSHMIPIEISKNRLFPIKIF